MYWHLCTNIKNSSFPPSMGIYLQHHLYVLQHYLHDSIIILSIITLCTSHTGLLTVSSSVTISSSASSSRCRPQGELPDLLLLLGLLPGCWQLSVPSSSLWCSTFTGGLPPETPSLLILLPVLPWPQFLEFFSLCFGKVVLDANSLVAASFKLLEVFHECVLGDAVGD